MKNTCYVDHNGTENRRKRQVSSQVCPARISAKKRKLRLRKSSEEDLCCVRRASQASRFRISTIFIDDSRGKPRSPMMNILGGAGSAKPERQVEDRKVGHRTRSCIRRNPSNRRLGAFRAARNAKERCTGCTRGVSFLGLNSHVHPRREIYANAFCTVCCSLRESLPPTILHF